MRPRWALMAAAVFISAGLAERAIAIPADTSPRASQRWSGSFSTRVSAACGPRTPQGSCRAGPRPRPGPPAPRDYYEYDANKLPFGTERWRDQMRRENRLGNPG
jgi:hypothetical protein